MPKFFFYLNATYQELISLPIKIRTFFLSEDHQQKNKWFGQKMLKKWRGFFQISWKWLGLSKQFNTTFEAILSFSLKVSWPFFPWKHSAHQTKASKLEKISEISGKFYDWCVHHNFWGREQSPNGKMSNWVKVLKTPLSKKLRTLTNNLL